jgi:hypothetical protein
MPATLRALPCRRLPTSLAVLLLAGLRLVAADNPPGPAPAPPRVVELPPLMVSEANSGPPWHYLAAPGMEVLSRCSDEAAIHLVEEMHRLHHLLTVLLPEDLQARRTVPDIVVMYNDETKPVVTQEVVTSAEGFDKARRVQSDNSAVRYTPMPNLRLIDRDSTAAFFVIDEEKFPATFLTLLPDYIRLVLRNRTPAPPTWFVEGFVQLYADGDYERDPVTLSPVDWGTAKDTKSLRSDPDYPRAFVPLTDFFTQPPPTAPDKAALWSSQAALFLRWAMDGENHPRREALWRFVRRISAGEAMTEDLFRECFGLGYVDAQERLSDYLASAVVGSVHFDAGKPAPLPELEPRLANDADIARIKGDLERLEAMWIKARYPELTQKYLEQARRTFARAYDKGLRDPRLLAVMGLCEVDAGNDAGAKKYLESALLGGGPLRPRASYELARLRYDEAKKKPAGPSDQLSAEQATDVLQPLVGSRQSSPPLLETYALTAEVWSRSVPALTRQNLALLDEGVAYFPRNVPLIYQAAWLNARQGFITEAGTLIARGLDAGADPAFRTRLEQLRSRLSLANNAGTARSAVPAQP